MAESGSSFDQDYEENGQDQQEQEEQEEQEEGSDFEFDNEDDQSFEDPPTKPPPKQHQQPQQVQTQQKQPAQIPPLGIQQQQQKQQQQFQQQGQKVQQQQSQQAQQKPQPPKKDVAPSSKDKQVAKVENQPFDEAVELSHGSGEEVTSDSEEDKQEAPQGQKASGGFQDGESSEGSEEAIPPGGYNPADYANLNVNDEVKELFQYIKRYKVHNIELDTKIKCFIPEYIPAVGEVDAYLKPSRPDNQKEFLGLNVLDEPALNQYDPTILELKLSQVLKPKRAANESQSQIVRSLEQADKNPKQIARWVQSVNEIHNNKPAPTVSYSRQMPDIDNLMEAWPPEVEDAFNSLKLPTPDIDVDLPTYATILCNILDIPVYRQLPGKSLTESLHVMFTLYSEFKANPHFQKNNMEEEANTQLQTAM